jgi:two-component system NtrC family sensor kinase
MLLHSKSTKGEKQSTDILSLCEQSLGLAFNSIGANFPTLNCTVEKNLEVNIPQLKIIPQDLSRVLINIFNNAFYALNQKVKKAGASYIPVVNINVFKNDKSVYISVKDNGIGIPDSDKDKIFQPFFTTKPTGQGTGLGLSTGYEIVKAHGGEMVFASVKDEFTEMTIRLPL